MDEKDIQIIEQLLTREEPVLAFDEFKAVVKMMYEIYKEVTKEKNYGT